MTTTPLTASGRPTVAVVGRPNVGKSTLFNRIVGRRLAIVEEKPGVTRDRKEVEADWLGRQFTLIDTGGWMPGGSALDEKVSRQSEKAMEEASVVLFVVDANTGVMDEERQIARRLQKIDTPVLVVVNKVDDANRENAIWDFMSLGLGTPVAVSALHGRATGDLLDEVIAHFPDSDDDVDEPVEDDPDKVFSIAIVGRPNVGKSTLFNRLTGDDRAVVHDMAGTTRDSIDTIVETEDGPVRFVDTAGMRRKTKVDSGTEYYSVVRALQSIDSADVALLVIDATEGVTHQDQRLAERVDAGGCPIVVVLNKWELLGAEQRAELSFQVERQLYFVGDAPVLKISALTGKGVSKLLPTLEGTIDDYSRRVPTRQVNDVLKLAQASQPAPHGGRILYATQGATDPPTFTLFVNRELPHTYLRYIERRIREDLDFGSTPIKLRVRKRS